MHIREILCPGCGDRLALAAKDAPSRYSMSVIVDDDGQPIHYPDHAVISSPFAFEIRCEKCGSTQTLRLGEDVEFQTDAEQLVACKVRMLDAPDWRSLPI